MPLTTVTITGADGEVSPKDLRELSERFPFVEWGILIGSRTTWRFPSTEWIRSLIEERFASDNRMKLSLHICGQFLREIAIGHSSLDRAIGPCLAAFSRVQLNWHGDRQNADVGENVLQAFCKLDGFGWDPQIIFQFDGVNDGLWTAAGRRFAVAALFDKSHGAGVAPRDWPNASIDIPCGWAGGLGPDNLKAEIPRIDAKAWPAMNYWIDMETKVRTDGAFDLAKVEEALSLSAEFVK